MKKERLKICSSCMYNTIAKRVIIVNERNYIDHIVKKYYKVLKRNGIIIFIVTKFIGKGFANSTSDPPGKFCSYNFKLLNCHKRLCTERHSFIHSN